ncbi:hypothetical protein FBY41_1977 [Humibacillus xanthopallidus]|uniref:Uncharacterized protein n=1 Tax=Humibacillus xanthopallidus TaxID=412689 RepID=A0A543HUE8_9MICO|nr:hypothetical protein FBY41_1977 [Humibacillus xanthopallidus]
MSRDEESSARSQTVGWSIAILDAPEVDEFDLDLQLGELTRLLSPHWLGMPFAAQTDAPCDVPTGGRGAGTTCNTQDNTCAATCAGLNTCPNTQCGNTCAATCHTCQTECHQATCFCTEACPTDNHNGLGMMVCQLQ